MLTGPLENRVPARAALRLLAVMAAVASSAGLSGCGSLYLLQAASGQWHVMRARVPIERLLADPATPPGLRARLGEVRAAREFASQQLGLPDNSSYRSYADIHRPYVVWNVVAAPEFSVEPKHWCFPVAGCVAYRGYFHERQAREFALGLEARGFDVALDGVPAYSTLGKFADPVLSSMMGYGDDVLAATIFHELAHQLLYVRDDTAFNEAFATTVEDAGLERWLAHRGESQRMQRFRAEQADEQAFVNLLERRRAQLAALYASGAPPARMREQKAAIFAQLAADVRALERARGPAAPLYEEWLAQGLNNARLASVATYFDCEPGFRRLLAQSDGDLMRFYAAARALAREPRAVRHQRLCSADAELAGS